MSGRQTGVKHPFRLRHRSVRPFSGRVDAEMTEQLEYRQCGGLGLALLLSAPIKLRAEKHAPPPIGHVHPARQQHSRR